MAVLSKGVESLSSPYWLIELTDIIRTDSGRKVTKVFDRILDEIANNNEEIRKLVRATVSLCFVNDKRNFAMSYLIKYKSCFTSKERDAYIRD